MGNWRAYTSEFIGTFGLVFIGAGSICTDAMTSGQVGILGVALAHGVVLALLVSTLMRFSGAHFNPAITFSLWLAKKLASREVAPYVMSQLLGAVVASLLLSWIYPKEIWSGVSLGAPVLGPDFGAVSGILVEIILTFFLVFVIFGTAVDPQGPRQLSGLAIGGVLVFDILVGGPLTGAAMNPARAFGPALVAGFWEAHYVYWIGPIVGAIMAGSIYTFISSQKLSSETVGNLPKRNDTVEDKTVLGDKRNILAILFFSVITLGFYWLYWYYIINYEMKKHSPHITVTPGVAVFCMFVPFVNWVSLYNTANRALTMKKACSDPDSLSPGAALLFAIFLPFGIYTYMVQSALNNHWQHHGGTIR